MPTTVVAAASFDDMIALTGYTIFINIAVQGSGNKGWHIARGPLSVVFGILLGMAAAVICSFTKLWNTNYKRSFMLVASGAMQQPPVPGTSMRDFE
jgi:Kef-type K+ transport system membrane component KefB